MSDFKPTTSTEGWDELSTLIQDIFIPWPSEADKEKVLSLLRSTIKSHDDALIEKIEWMKIGCAFCDNGKSCGGICDQYKEKNQAFDDVLRIIRS